jgi:hypothetical protein
MVVSVIAAMSGLSCEHLSRSEPNLGGYGSWSQRVGDDNRFDLIVLRGQLAPFLPGWWELIGWTLGWVQRVVLPLKS